jgi:hypothetical protein
LISLYILLNIISFYFCPSGSWKKAVVDIFIPEEQGVAARQKGDNLNYEKQPVFPFACFHIKHLLPYGVGMVIMLVSSVISLFDIARPSNVVLAPSVVAALAAGMMVPRNVLSVPIEAAPVGTQNTLVLVALAVPPKFITIVLLEVNAPVERKIYTPGVLKVRFEPTDIPPVTQYTPGASVSPPKS